MAGEAAKDGVCERVISCSMSDFFIAQADDWRDDAWNHSQTPNLISFVDETPERIMGHLPKAGRMSFRTCGSDLS